MKNTICKLCLNAHQPQSELQTYVSKKVRNLGYILILAEITQSTESEKKQIIKNIINKTREYYFNSATQGLEKALEDTLQKINLFISESIKQTKKEWLSTANIVIIACKNQEVHFAKIGKINSLLLSEKEIVEITENKLNTNINPIKPFANIYSGSIPNNASILFLTENILDYVAQEKIRIICTEHSCQSSLKQLKTILKKAPADKSFGSILIQRNNQKSKKTTKKPQTKKETLQEAKTEEAEGGEGKATVVENKKPTIQTPKTLKNKKKSQKSTSESQNISTPQKRLKPQNTKKKLPSKVKIKFSKRPSVVKILAFSIAIISIWFLINIFSNQDTQPQPEKTEDTTQSASAINTIQEKFISAQNLLIMDKKQEARSALKEIIILVDALPAKTEQQKYQKTTLQQKTRTQLLIAQNVKLTIPTLLAEIPNFVAEKIILKGDKIYTFNPVDSSVYSINPQTGVITKLEIVSKGIGSLTDIIDHTGEGLVFYHSGQGLAKLDIEKNILSPLKWDRSGEEAPTASDIYQNKLYTISTANKILKYTNSITGFTQEVEWSQLDSSPTNISNANSLAIDGSVWVLKNNQVIKLFKGKREDFTAEIAPQLEGATELFTDLDLKYLYVLDPPTHRIIILNKSGKLINQITAQQFLELKDMAINEAERKIYLLDTNKIFEVVF